MFLKNFKFLSIVLAAFLTIGLVSCSDSDADQVLDSSDFSEETVNKYRGGDRDHKGCLDLVYPITIQFSDNTTAEVTDKANLRETIKAWFTNTGADKTETNRPTFVFPISVEIDGETVEVTSQDEFDEIAGECRGEKRGKRGGKKGKRGRGHHDGGFGDFLSEIGYSPVYPVSISIGGETKEFTSEEEIEAAIEAYVETLGEDDEFEVEPVFPISFTNDETGETVTFNNEEELETFLEENFDRGHECEDTFGDFGNYSVVYPVSIDFNGDVQEFNSEDEVAAAIDAYFEANGEDAVEPTPVFPLSFTNEETGETVTFNSQEELDAFLEENFGGKRKGGKKGKRHGKKRG